MRIFHPLGNFAPRRRLGGMSTPTPEPSPTKKKTTTETVVSRILGPQSFVELLYDPVQEKTSLAVWKDGTFEVVAKYAVTETKQLVPVSANNNLIKHDVLLLPSSAKEYGEESDLIASIQSFIHRYCDLGERFEIVAIYYVLLSWVYDRFRELPYLRMQGDYGTGKTRFLQVVGSLCYKPLFASGASTISPIFHTLNTFRGTLVMDEADFRFSDEKADIIKILNNGNMKGFPLLRSKVSRAGTYNPKAFNVFGPKVLATRGAYQDPALESRIITLRAGTGNIRADIPLTLPESFELEACTLRNKLLMYRFKNWHTMKTKRSEAPEQTSLRVSQIFRPLLAVAKDQQARSIICQYASESDVILKSSLAHTPQENLLKIIRELMDQKASPLSIKAIACAYQIRHGAEHTAPVTNKWVGGVLRGRLHLATVKRNGIYVIPETEMPRLRALFKRYGVVEEKEAA